MKCGWIYIDKIVWVNNSLTHFVRNDNCMESSVVSHSVTICALSVKRTEIDGATTFAVSGQSLIGLKVLLAPHIPTEGPASLVALLS
ncbi:hypothetical protein L6452_02198 [Arctium lappa]|uniref:Uncharacterized protein n=1 Tax=Arctium lappa TaxID=4217 RepID=A0ACB9FJN0_ARCLA|nr:hypothetical protein L6452_02198 [Arctium lappa]